MDVGPALTQMPVWLFYPWDLEFDLPTSQKISYMETMNTITLRCIQNGTLLKRIFRRMFISDLKFRIANFGSVKERVAPVYYSSPQSLSRSNWPTSSYSFSRAYSVASENFTSSLPSLTS